MRPLMYRDDLMYSTRAVPDDERLRLVQLVLRMEVPLNWHNGGHSALSSLAVRMGQDREFALDVLDFLLHFVAPPDQAEALNRTLAFGGSEWEVVEIGDNQRQLSRRMIGPVRNSIDSIRTDSQRAHHHLMSAWAKLTGRQPDASAVYREAIKAVEAAARPIVSPANDRATLGTMIRDLRAKPDKWSVVLDKATAGDVANMATSYGKAKQTDMAVMTSPFRSKSHSTRRTRRFTWPSPSFGCSLAGTSRWITNKSAHGLRQPGPRGGALRFGLLDPTSRSDRTREPPLAFGSSFGVASTVSVLAAHRVAVARASIEV